MAQEQDCGGNSTSGGGVGKGGAGEDVLGCGFVLFDPYCSDTETGSDEGKDHGKDRNQIPGLKIMIGWIVC